MFDDLRAHLAALDGPWPTRKWPTKKRPPTTWTGPADDPPGYDGGGGDGGGDADAAGADRAEVPAHGLGADGSLARDVGGYQAVIAVEDPLTVRLTYVGADGYPLPTVPGALKVPHAGEVRELKALAKEVRGTLADERAHAESLMAVERAWRHGAWRRAWLDHPVSGAVARGLIWEFEDPDGIWHAATPGESVLVTVDGRALPVPPDGARVRLWHPARSRPGAVRAWRDFVVDNRMVQAFRQAFREVCVLAPDEAGAARSDRFAGHIVRYARLRELFRERGWRPDHRGRMHGGFQPAARRVLGGGGWRAVLRYDPADAAGQPEHVVTGHVRFERRDRRHWSRAGLADAPPLVFSEAMRDVDLFVDEASIAADPDWPDGEDRHHLHYRREAAFGGLTATAEVRRAALERLLPATRVADRCALDGRFLVVRGELRTYRIHVGTAHVRMEPDGGRLRVVPSRRKGQSNLFLPFEDERLSQVLTKAVLLAADHKITDEAVLRRIREGSG